jgi:hypothetical protein
MKYFDPAAFDGYKVVNSTAGPIQNPLGYMLFVRGDRTQIDGPGSTTLRTKGLLYRDNLSFTVDPAVGFNSVGNPYASRINLKNIVKNGTYVDAFTIWNPDLAGLYGVGGYESLIYDGPSGNYINSVSGATVNTIESGQAFYIQTNSTTVPGTVNLTENVKTFGSANVSFAPDPPEITLRLRLFSKPGNQPDYTADGALITFDRRYAEEIDNQDVKKLFNSSDNLAIFSGDNYLVAERTGLPDHGDTVHLALYSTREQAYRFDFEPTDLRKLGNLQPFLYDRYLQLYTPISTTGNSSVSFSISADAASKSPERFSIVFRKVQGRRPQVTLTAGRNADRTIAVNWKVENELDVEKYEIERSADGVVFTGIITTNATGNNNNTVDYAKTDLGPASGDNYYRIKATMRDGIHLYSDIVKVEGLREPIITGVKEIKVFPNPVTGKRMQVQFSNQATGNYHLQVVNQLGQVLQTTTVAISSANQKQLIQLNSSVAQGQYKLSITAPDGSKTQQSLFIE